MSDENYDDCGSGNISEFPTIKPPSDCADYSHDNSLNRAVNDFRAEVSLFMKEYQRRGNCPAPGMQARTPQPTQNNMTCAPPGAPTRAPQPRVPTNTRNSSMCTPMRGSVAPRRPTQQLNIKTPACCQDMHNSSTPYRHSTPIGHTYRGNPYGTNQPCPQAPLRKSQNYKSQGALPKSQYCPTPCVGPSSQVPLPRILVDQTEDNCSMNDSDEDVDEDDSNVCVAQDHGKEKKEEKFTQAQLKLKAYHTKITDQLVRDNYCPGAIQDTVNGVVNFNELALNAALEGAEITCKVPSPEPITLLEAFYKRIEHDRKMIFREPAKPVAEGENFDTIRDEQMKLVDDYFKNQHNTELTRALKTFIKAEKLFSMTNTSKNFLPFDAEIYSGKVIKDNHVMQTYSGNMKPKM